MDRYEAMKIFAKVAEMQSFTKAADSLNLPKATVSNNVQNIESLLGVRLLNRTTRQVQVTPEGSIFLERCKELLIDMDETESMFRRQSSEIKGEIRVDMPAAMANQTFLPILTDFTSQYPGIEIELSASDRTSDLVRDGIDCVLRSGKNNQDGLVEIEVGHSKMINCLSPAYAEKFGKPKNLDDLKNHRLILYTQVLGAKSYGFEYFDGLKYKEIKMTSTITVNNTDSYRAACLAGFGIIQIPHLGISNALKDGDLIEILPKHQAEPLPFYLIYPQKKLVAKRVLAFLDWFEPKIRNLLKAGKSPFIS
jgi:DNA-binding transcriptional LysR family regulator